MASYAVCSPIMRSLIAFICAAFYASAVYNCGQHARTRLLMDNLLTVLLKSPSPLSVLAFQHVQIKQPIARRRSSSRSVQHIVFATKGDQSSSKKQNTSKQKKNATNKAGNKKKRTSLKGNVSASKTSSSVNADKKRKARIKSSKKSKKKKPATTITHTKKSSEHTSTKYFIQFSRVFQRHVVYMSKTDTTIPTSNDQVVIESFLFLDDAITAYPTARIVAPRDVPFPPPLCTIDWTHMSSSSSAAGGIATGGYNKVEEECETTIAGMGLFGLCELEYDVENDHVHNKNGKYPVDTSTSTTTIDRETGNNQQLQQQHDVQSNEALRTLLRLVSSSSSSVIPRHFFRLDHRRFALGGHTPESITINHARIVSLLSCGRDSGSSSIGLAMSSTDVTFVLSNFPQLCLYDTQELETFVRFLLAPLPSSTIPSVTLVADTGVGGEKVDWPRLANEGYGVGLTLEQATKAMRLMPELMALYYEDSRKPSVGYMYTQLQQQILPELCDEVKMQLGQFLEGADFSDTLTLGYLYNLGISWKKLRLLLSAFPLWTTNNLDPGWEILQRGPVRSSLKRHSLDYLRQRLQIRPSDVYKMLKTHTRLSTYDAATKILPTLDKLQRSLGLRNSELRQLILRMPSVIGMGTSKSDAGKLSAFDQRLDFFQNEGKNCVSSLSLIMSFVPDPTHH